MLGVCLDHLTGGIDPPAKVAEVCAVSQGELEYNVLKLLMHQQSLWL